MVEPKEFWRFVVTVLVGIGLTVIALPMLLVATCIPLMAGDTQLSGRVWYIALGLACAVASLVVAFARNEGTRWGAIALLVLLAMALARFLIPSFH